jgi:hypothetical protein
MRKMSLSIFLLITANVLIGQENTTTENNLTEDYVYGIFYYNKLDHLRGSYRRNYTALEDMGLGRLNATIYDFNFGKNTEGLKLQPMTLGFSFASRNKKSGFYFLLSSSNFMFNPWARDSTWVDEKISGQSLGYIYLSKHFSLQSDVTHFHGNLSIYGRVYIPIIKTHFGAGTSPYDEIIDPIDQQKKIVKSNVTSIDRLSFGTSIIPYFDVGLKLLRVSQVRYIPNFSFSLNQLMSNERMKRMRWDATLFFESRLGKVTSLDDFKDYDIRFTLYRLSNSFSQDEPIDLRFTAFLSASYKSPVDLFTNTLTESGKIFTGQTGLGGELGIGIRAIGIKKYHVPEETYVKASIYYNYSEYFELYPGQEYGIKFKVTF